MVGPGGIGKTRLALEIAWQVGTDYMGPFMHGVYFVPLVAILPDRGWMGEAALPLLITAVAQALGISFSNSLDPLPELLNFLQDKAVLLVLDNMEHLLEVGRLLVTSILEATREVDILVISRERLNLRQEWCLEIEGLNFPLSIPDDAFNEVTAAYDAVHLFVQRARQVSSQFLLEDDAREETAVIQICQLVEGMPLAIELAAAWVRILPCGDIAQEIEQALDILSTTMADLPPRHRSMRAVFEHSWHLLTADEQRVVRQLAIFQGGFSRQAAKQVVEATLLLLSNLADKSLLRRVQHKYDMHPLLRQYSIEKLQAYGSEYITVQDKHAHYYGQFLHQREPLLYGTRQRNTLKEIGSEIENIRAGWFWAAEHKKIALIGQYAKSLHNFYDMRSWQYEGVQVFEQAAYMLRELLGVPPSASEEVLLVFVKVLACYGEFHYALGQLETAEQILSESLAVSNQIEDPKELAFAYRALGLTTYVQGKYKTARPYLELGLQIAQEIEDDYESAHILLSMGALAHAQGRYNQAMQFFQDSLTTYRAIDHRWGIAHCLRWLGTLAQLSGEYVRAEQYHRESWQLCQEIDNQVGAALSLNGLGQAAQRLQQYEAAQGYYQQALTLFQEVNNRIGIVRTLNHLGIARFEQGQHQTARECFHQALEIALGLRSMALILRIFSSWAQLEVNQPPHTHQWEQALGLLTLVYSHPASDEMSRQQAAASLTKLAVDVPPPLALELKEKRSFSEIVTVATDILNQY